MPWIYHQANGVLEHQGPHALLPVYRNGYSGAPGCVNNPHMETFSDKGPIPRGNYEIGLMYDDPPPKDHKGHHKHKSHKGPHVMNLKPKGHKAHGRHGFMIHGDNGDGNRSASNGCVILPEEIRLRIGHSGDRVLHVR
jgi:hypothetical protein